jgi:hypothetical protein
MRNLILAALILALPAQAADLSDWFKSLKRPGTGISCCDVSDCRGLDESDVRIVDGAYQVFVEGDWRPVPDHNVLQGQANLLRKPMACYRPDLGVMCFLPWGNLT